MQTIKGTVTKNENLLSFLAIFESLKFDYFFKILNFSIWKLIILWFLVIYG